MKQNLLNSLRLRLCMLVALFCTLSTSVWGAKTTIASWGKVSIAANTAIKASGGDAKNKNIAQYTSTKAMTTAGNNCYYGSSAGGAVITFSNLDLTDYTDVTMTFYTRASQQGTMQIAWSSDGSNYTNLNAPSITKSEAQKTSNTIPNTAKYIKLTHSASTGSLYFGTIVIEGTLTHTLTYSATNGSISGVVYNTSTAVASGASVAEGGKVTLTATPDAGYEFDSWSVSGTGSILSSTSTNPTTFTMGTANSTVTANFVASGGTPTYALTITEPIGGTITVKDSEDNDVSSGDKFEENAELTLSAAASTGYTFTTWTTTAGTFGGAATTAANTFTMPASAATIGATFTVNTHSLSLTSANGTCATTVNGETWDGSSAIPYGAAVVVAATPNSGYQFNSWTCSYNTVTTNGNEISFTMPDADVTLTANYSVVPTHTATFSVNGTTSTQDFAEGAAITFPSNPADISGKKFVGWATAAIDGTTNTAPSFVTSATMGSSDVTYYAVFAEASTGQGTVAKTLTITPSHFTSLSGQYNETTTTKTVEGNSYTITIQACKQNSQIQMRDNATLSYIYFPTLPGNITNVSTTTCDNASGTGSYTGTIHLKSSKTRGNSDTDDITKAELSSVSSFSIDVTGNVRSFYLLTSAGLRLSDLTVTYEGTGETTVYSNYCTTVETPTVATPTFSPEAGAVVSGTTVTIACATDDATIYYTTDDSAPTTNSSVYSTPIEITTATTLKAIAVKDGYNNSDVATAAYTIAVSVANPTFSPAAGAVAPGTTVTIACATDDATIYYTTDDSAPTTSSSVYSTPIEITTATTLKAIAVKDGMANSAVAEAAYTIIYTVTLSDDTENPMTEYSAGVGVTLPERSTIGGYTFAGWSETNVSEETTTAPTIIPAGTYYPTSNMTLYPVYTKTVAGGGTSHETASVTISEYATANSWANSTKYTSVTLDENVTASTYDKTGTGNTGKYYSNGNTWRFYQSEDAKVTISTTSGELTSVTFTFDVSNTGTLNYNSSAVTSGTAVNVSGTSAEFTVGNSVSATNGQVKITAISVNYDVTGGSTTYYWSAPVAAAVETPEIAIAENPFLFSTTATITCATEGAAIKYSYDGETWSDYSAALTITETKTIYAKAIKNTDESSVAQVTATKNLATPTVTVSGDLTLDLDGETNVSAGTLSAAVTYNEAAVAGATVTWSSSNTDIATIDASGAVTIKATGSVTFTATYAGNSDYAEATGTKTVTVIDNNAPGSEGNPYTVAQAIDAIDNSGNVTNVYVSGIVSQVDEYLSNYRSITYWISEDGTTTSTQFEVYSGKGINGADFSSINDIEVGDIVVVKGDIKKYNDVYEFNYSSQIVSRTTKTASDLTKTNDIDLSMANTSVTATATDYFTTSSTGALSYEIADESVATVSDAGVVTPVAAGTTTLTVSQAADATYKAGSLEITVIVAALTLNETTIAANESGSITYGTNKVEGYMIDNTYDGTVAAVSSNPAVATVAITQHTAGEGTFTITPVAVGTAVITISAPATATCVAADDVTYTITINAPVGQTSAVVSIDPVTLDFTDNTNWGLPEGSYDKLVDEHSYSNGAYTIKVAGSSGNGYYWNNYLLMGKQGAYLTLPAFDKAVTQIDVVGKSGASSNVKQNIYVGETAVSIETTGADGVTNEYAIDKNYQAAGTIYTLKVTSAHNTQITSIVVHFEGESITAILNASGYASYCSQYPLDFTDAESDGYSAWQITEVSASNEITFTKITGSVKGGTGMLLKGTASETITLTSADSETTLSDNKLVGTLAPTYVAADQYYGLSGQTFVKVNAGTVKAGKALLPAGLISANNSARAFTFVFVDPTTGITETQNVSAEEFGAIFNLAGQRVSQPQRGVNIINGKKTLFVK